MKTWLAAVRLRATPPAFKDMRKHLTSGSAMNRVMTVSLFGERRFVENCRGLRIWCKILDLGGYEGNEVDDSVPIGKGKFC